jgi:hypothetical protein
MYLNKKHATRKQELKELGGLSTGDTFIICDAGGGTVDLISHAIEQLEPSLQVKESAPGSGALRRSTYLNGRFQEFLVSKLGQEEGFDHETVDDAMKKFDEDVCCSTNCREPPLTMAPLD